MAIEARPETQAAQAADTLDAALAQTLTLIADDVLLDELLHTLDAQPGARDVLLGISVYREPVDRLALLFQVGADDEAAAFVPDHAGAEQRILTVLANYNISVEEFTFDSLPKAILTEIQADRDELQRMPWPPLSTPNDLDSTVRALAKANLVEVDPEGRWAFVHRWTATELDSRWRANGMHDELRQAHRRAAQYWEWRSAVWPQDSERDLHDALEARHHFIAASDLDNAERVSQAIVQRLHISGAWDHETALIHDSLERLARTAKQRAVWFHQLGALAQDRGSYEEAETGYTGALGIFEEIGDRAGVAASLHQLGNVAYLRGDYVEAEGRFIDSFTINKELANRSGMAVSSHTLGVLAQSRGNYADAERHHTTALGIFEELGDRHGMARCFEQLGTIAYYRGDYVRAEQHYTGSFAVNQEVGSRSGMATSLQKLGIVAQARAAPADAERLITHSLSIFEELGSLSGMAITFHELGILAQDRGDLVEAERRFTQSLALKEEIGSRTGIATSLHQLGLLAQLRGDYVEAERLITQSLDIFEELGDRANKAICLQQLGILTQERGDFVEAERLLTQSLDIFKELESHANIAATMGRLRAVS